jgi:hypothetical protein
MKDLVRRLEVVALKDRDWVEAVHYIGPDRRRFNSGEYNGPLKRNTDGDETPYQARINQALKIVRAAVHAVDTDPEQALRAMLTQATTLQSLSTDFKLMIAAGEFNRHLTGANSRGGKLNRAEVEQWAAPLLAFLPKTGARAVAA